MQPSCQPSSKFWIRCLDISKCIFHNEHEDIHRKPSFVEMLDLPPSSGFLGNEWDVVAFHWDGTQKLVKNNSQTSWS